MKTPSAPIEVTRRQLYNMVWGKPLTSVAEELGMSVNGLAKVCDRVNVPYPARGYWARSRAGRAPPKPPLPPKTAEDASHISFQEERSASRRTQSRKSPEERREELIRAARQMIVRDGLHRTTMKRLAVDIGVSEALAHNYFTRDALLVEIARRELAEIEESRQADMATAGSAQERGVIGTRRYLQEVARRGVLIQTLVTHPSVREALKQERKSKSREGQLQLTRRYEREYGVPPELMRPAGRMMTAVALRAGRLLAHGKIDLETAERLTIPIIGDGNKRIVERWSVKK